MVSYFSVFHERHDDNDNAKDKSTNTMKNIESTAITSIDFGNCKLNIYIKLKACKMMNATCMT